MNWIEGTDKPDLKRNTLMDRLLPFQRYQYVPDFLDKRLVSLFRFF